MKSENESGEVARLLPPKKSWNHTMLAVAEADRLGYRCATHCSRGKLCPGRVWVPAEWCSYWRGAPTVFVATYSYVTGRAGRVSTRELALCEPCAAKWAAKHLPKEARHV